MDNPDSIFCYLKLEKAVFDVAKSAKKKSTKKESTTRVYPMWQTHPSWAAKLAIATFLFIAIFATTIHYLLSYTAVKK